MIMAMEKRGVVSGEYEQPQTKQAADEPQDLVSRMASEVKKVTEEKKEPPREWVGE
jgi:hypothetical protein